ncbi:glycoside hydrolase family 26 protein [Flavimarina sp. Hel_I_48]|uniref:glycoside hydrolase family 26 protein n=1 Tax=Flavimarina sp. Hel_I_48 TaxID=1392488 RepID=UPI00068F6A11|nr:glycosyl hydrolase [Flavimarina sp. Hel_I_48]
MIKTVHFVYFVFIALILTSCGSSLSIPIQNISLADSQASVQTKLLKAKIDFLAKKGISIGQQDPTAYGIGWKASSQNKYRSDMHDVIGKYPAVQGWDLGHIELGHDINLDTVSFNLMRHQIIEAHKRGAITTLSWHLDNPQSGGSSWDTTAAVKTIMKEGLNRSKYIDWVSKLADFIKSIKDEKGNAIPLVFRAYHEMNGGWFWWGAASCTPEEYKALYRDFVQLLGDNDVHNLLYAYSPNTLNNPQEYERFYPGDAFVDILGMDIYNHGGDAGFAKKLQQDLSVVRQFAETHNKVLALTETGNVAPGNPKWWTQILYPGIKDTGIAWVLFWRNARKDHYFGIYPKEASATDFKAFAKREDILFLEDIDRYSFKPKNKIY